jgi:epoxyqueuosine reductase QueG
LFKINPRLVYSHFNEAISIRFIDQISMQLAKEMERRFDCVAVPVPCDTPYEYWDAERSEGRGLISMKHAAVYAGLGSLGKNTLLLNRQFGSMLDIGAVLTDLSLPSDPLAESVCIDGCTKCIDSCPAGAIQNGAVIQKLCREFSYGQKTAKGYETTECNLCRTVCPVAFGKK